MRTRRKTNGRRFALHPLNAVAGAPIKTHTDMKIIIGLLAIFCAIVAQIAFLGINGLTLVSLPLTLFLGFEVLERLQDDETKNQTI